MGKGERGKRLRDALHSAQARVDNMELSLGELEDARKLLDKSAAEAQQRIAAFFDQVAQHKHGLAGGVRTVRKEANQPIADAVNVGRVLERVRRRAVGGHGAGGALDASTQEEQEHVGLALAAVKCRGGGRRRVVFAVPNGGTIPAVLAEWKGACRVRIDVGGGEWEARKGVRGRLPSLNTARNYLAAAVVTRSNHVFVVGGDGGRGPFNSVERLGEGDSAWQEEARLAIPTARYLCGACAVGTNLIVVAGRNRVSTDAVEAVDTVSGVHTTLPPVPRKMKGCGVVSLHGKVIVTGGQAGSSDLDTVWMLDLGNARNLQQRQQRQQQQQPGRAFQWVPLASLALARRFHGAAAGGGCVFVCGGKQDYSRLSSCEMLRMTPAVAGGKREWEALPQMPDKLHWIGCCYGGGNVFVAGGYSGYNDTVYALNVRERGAAWRGVATLALGRIGCAAVCVGRRLLVLGGSDRDDDLARCEVFQF